MQEAKHFLARLLQLPLEELDRALRAEYMEIFIPKRNGGKRQISIPEPTLKKVQRRILKRILYRTFSPIAIKGFRPGGSVVSNAHLHLSMVRERKNSLVRYVPPYVLRVDLKDAFGTVSNALFEQFKDKFCQRILGTQELFRAKIRLATHRRYENHYWDSGCPQCKELLLKIDDRSSENIVDQFLKQVLKSKKDPGLRKLYYSWLRNSKPEGQLELFSEWETSFNFQDLVRETINIFIKLCFHNGSLPQGAPTSPYLLNLAIQYSGLLDRLYEIEGRLGDPLCIGPEDLNKLFVFSIYADDITFSSSVSFRSRPFENDHRTLRDIIVNEIEKDGIWKVNDTKTREYHFKKEMPMVTGLRLTPNGPILPKKKIRYLRSFFHHNRNSTDQAIIAKLNGWRGYLRMIYGDNLPKQLGNTR